LDLDFVANLARQAGEVALAATAELRSELKADFSYVTNVDRAVEQLIRDQLEARWPDCGYFGEETGRERLDAEWMWVVDPIDGTTNLVHGLPTWGVSIGLLHNREPHLGVFYLPLLNEMYRARRGHGAYCNDRAIRAREVERLEQEETVGIGGDALKVLDLRAFPSRQRNSGTVGSDIVFTARGALCANVNRNDRLYDVAAPLCIALEAGCEATWLDGSSVSLQHWFEHGLNDTPMIVAHPHVTPLIRQVLHPLPPPII
jgi:myo-inositol-1(or 4)-monophosphatase